MSEFQLFECFSCILLTIFVVVNRIGQYFHTLWLLVCFTATENFSSVANASVDLLEIYDKKLLVFYDTREAKRNFGP